MAKKSRQLKYQHDKKAAGLCCQCGQPQHPRSKALCGECLEKHRRRGRRKHGYREWEPGQAGRAPLGREEEIYVKKMRDAAAVLRKRFGWSRAKIVRSI